MFDIPINSEDYPNIVEAAKAKKELAIVQHQSISLLKSKPVKHFMFAVETDIRDVTDKNAKYFYMILNAFNYGYILGKRAERAKRRNRGDIK